MLIPEIGASKVMYVATSIPAKTPVYLAMFLVFDASKTVSIKINEIAASAMNATGTFDPGTVVTKRTEGFESQTPITVEITRTPSTPPRNCAAI
jgi:hypothetical protein